VSLVQCIDRLELEIVEGEGEESCQIRHTSEARPDRPMVGAKVFSMVNEPNQPERQKTLEEKVSKASLSPTNCSL
jgi:hypothetical protein